MAFSKRWRHLKTEITWWSVGVLGKWLIDFLFFTTPVETVGFERVSHLYDTKKGIAAFWHSRILLFSYLFKGWNAAILVSGSRDGEFVARVVQNQGHEPIRGSSTRGGLRAIAGLIRILNQGRPGVVIPDGPQGPRFCVQPGIITLAKKTGQPVVPMTYSAKRIKIFNSWDRFVLPFPFTRCRVIYGEPVHVPKDADSEMEFRCLTSLENELRRITTEADRHFGHDID